LVTSEKTNSGTFEVCELIQTSKKNSFSSSFSSSWMNSPYILVLDFENKKILVAEEKEKSLIMKKLDDALYMTKAISEHNGIFKKMDLELKEVDITMRANHRNGSVSESFLWNPKKLPEIEAGTHISRSNNSFDLHTLIHSTVIEHHGIYINDECVIHLTGVDKTSSIVQKTTMAEFLNYTGFGNEVSLFIYKHKHQFKSLEKVANLATSLIGKDGYDLFKFNCEHFATYCSTGVLHSTQIGDDFGVAFNFIPRAYPTARLVVEILLNVASVLGKIAFRLSPAIMNLIVDIAKISVAYSLAGSVFSFVCELLFQWIIPYLLEREKGRGESFSSIIDFVKKRLGSLPVPLIYLILIILEIVLCLVFFPFALEIGIIFAGIYIVLTIVSPFVKFFLNYAINKVLPSNIEIYQRNLQEKKIKHSPIEISVPKYDSKGMYVELKNINRGSKNWIGLFALETPKEKLNFRNSLSWNYCEDGLTKLPHPWSWNYSSKGYTIAYFTSRDHLSASQDFKVKEESFQFEKFNETFKINSINNVGNFTMICKDEKNANVKIKSSLLCEENVWNSKIHSIEIYLGKTLVHTLKDFDSKIQEICLVEYSNEEYMDEPNQEMIQLLNVETISND
jgi:hypothetical protein